MPPPQVSSVNYNQVQSSGSLAGGGPVGANIYSLATGMYPILAANTHVGDLSTSGFSRQAMSAAPDIYNVIEDPTGRPPQIRQPYLQGNFIMQTEATGDVGTIRSAQEVDDLLPAARQQFPSRVRSLMLAAQAAITGNQINSTRVQYATIQSGGRSAEEMTQPGGDYQFVPAGQDGLGEGTANQPDLYNPITNQYVNVTQSRLDSIGHGVYGQGGRDMQDDIADIRRDMISGAVDEETGYDAITARGLEYFRGRAEHTWNPFIRDAREQLASIERSNRNLTTGSQEERMQRMRELILRGSVGPAAAIGGQTVATGAVTNFASVGARTMTGQHFGNREAMFGGGMLETYPIGPHTFGWFGPFTMFQNGTNIYEYDVNRIDGGWFQNYQFSSPSEAITSQSGIAASDARLRHAAWITKSHDSGARRAAIGAITTGAIFGYTTSARRLRPYVDLINASEQMSNAIDGIVQTMSNFRTIPPSLHTILSSYAQSFTVNQQTTMNNTNIWAAPYIAIFGQQYATGTPL